MDNERVCLRYHRAKDPNDRGKFMIFERNDDAYWLDQFEPIPGTDTPKFEPSSRFEVSEGPD